MQSDEELVNRWNGGDSGAGEVVMRRHRAAVRRFFAFKVADAADDLTQLTLMRCVEGKTRFDGRSRFRTYLFGIARNVLFEHLRRRVKNATVDLGTVSLESLDPSPGELISAGEDRRWVLTALRALPSDQQVVLELYYWENLGIDELADMLEVPRGTIKSRLYYARKSLLRELGDEGTDPRLG